MSVPLVNTLCHILIGLQDLTMWVIALTLSMFLWVLFIVIEAGAILAENYFGDHVFEAFEFIIDIFKSFSWIILLLIAKSPVFKPAIDTTDPQLYNQPTYSTAPHRADFYYSVVSKDRCIHIEDLWRSPGLGKTQNGMIARCITSIGGLKFFQPYPSAWRRTMEFYHGPHHYDRSIFSADHQESVRNAFKVI